LLSRSGLSISLRIAGMRACWRPCGYLQQTLPVPAFVSFSGTLKRIVLTTHRQPSEGWASAPPGSDPRTPPACAPASACRRHVRRPGSASDAESRCGRRWRAPRRGSPAVPDERNLTVRQERAVFCQKPCTRSLRCNTVTGSICWLAHARAQPCNVGARDPLPGVRSGICAGRMTHGR
jgi:hypothetical protein